MIMLAVAHTKFLSEALPCLRGAGFDIIESRFPFTYHHDFCRSLEANAGSSRGDIAHKVKNVKDIYDEDTYFAVCAVGSIYYLAQTQPHTFVKAMTYNRNFSMFVNRMMDKISMVAPHLLCFPAARS